MAQQVAAASLKEEQRKDQATSSEHTSKQGSKKKTPGRVSEHLTNIMDWQDDGAWAESHI